jgi:hypothetical protein
MMEPGESCALWDITAYSGAVNQITDEIKPQTERLT